jgi:hypothetical protein
MNLARGKTVMTTEQQRKILEAAAKACGVYLLWHERWGCFYDYNKRHESKDFQEWNPIANSADTASMCAKLEIDTIWTDTAVICADDSREREQEVRHDCTDAGKEAAWRLAATMVAAKIGGYTDA